MSLMPGTAKMEVTKEFVSDVDELSVCCRFEGSTPAGGLIVASMTTEPEESTTDTCSERIPSPASVAMASLMPVSNAAIMLPFSTSLS